MSRKGKPGAPPETLETVLITVEKGLEGDFRGASAGRQVTILTKEQWEAACRDLGETLDWKTRRANLFCEGIEVPNREGTTLRIGSVELEVCEETKPCSVMEKARPGLRAALAPNWRGGYSCRVVKGGQISVGDEVKIVDIND